MAFLVSPLVSLRDEFNKLNPKRDRRSDGWIGDAAHAAGVSDHNPNASGAVLALDVDKDGVPMGRIVAHIIGRCKAGTERRLKYVIWNRVIWSASWGWTPRRYLGTNPHTSHAHFSANGTGGGGSWGVATFGKPRPPKPSKPAAHPAGSRALRLAPARMSGADVRFVQRWIGPRYAGKVDGVYGPKTAAGVRWYQRMRGIKVDGVVGPATWRQMGVRWSGK